jgi:hypothetical protein
VNGENHPMLVQWSTNFQELGAQVLKVDELAMSM